VSHDVRTGELIKLPVFYFTFSIFVGLGKHPVSSADGMEVLFPNPAGRFVWMPTLCPPPESPENNAVQLTEGFLGHHWRVIIAPPPQYCIQAPNQCFLRHCSAISYYLPYPPVERLHVTFGWLDQ